MQTLKLQAIRLYLCAAWALFWRSVRPSNNRQRVVDKPGDHHFANYIREQIGRNATEIQTIRPESYHGKQYGNNRPKKLSQIVDDLVAGLVDGMRNEMNYQSEDMMSLPLVWKSYWVLPRR